MVDEEKIIFDWKEKKSKRSRWEINGDLTNILEASFGEIKTYPERLSELKTMSFTLFKEFIIRINWIIRSIPIDMRTIDWENVVLSWWVFWLAYQPIKDKEKGLHLLYEKVQESKSMSEASKLMYYGIQAIHPFEDWNWRTWRYIRSILNWKSQNDDILENSGIGRLEFEKKLENPISLNDNIKYRMVHKLFSKEFFEVYATFRFVWIIAWDVSIPELELDLDAERIFIKHNLTKIFSESQWLIHFKDIILLLLLKEKGYDLLGSKDKDKKTLRNWMWEEEIPEYISPEDFDKKVFMALWDRVINLIKDDKTAIWVKEKSQELKYEFLQELFDYLLEEST